MLRETVEPNGRSGISTGVVRVFLKPVIITEALVGDEDSTRVVVGTGLVVKKIIMIEVRKSNTKESAVMKRSLILNGIN